MLPDFDAMADQPFFEFFGRFLDERHVPRESFPAEGLEMLDAGQDDFALTDPPINAGIAATQAI